MKRFNKISILYSFILFIAACSSNNNSPGYTYSPDMIYSPAPGSYTYHIGDSTPRTIPQNTVPINSLPYLFPKSDSGLIQAKQFNAIPEGIIDSKKGKELYTVFCSNCHGLQGDGKGSLHLDGKYAYPPADLLSGKSKELTAGEIFHTISVGKGLMGAQSSTLNEEERWQISIYVKKVLQSEEP